MSKRSIQSSAMFITLSALLTACGGQAYQSSNPYPYIAPTPTVTVTPSPNPSPSPSESASDLPAPQQFTFKLQSSDSTATPSGVSKGTYTVANISTDNRFKVTLTSGAPQNIPSSSSSYYGYMANYTCQQFTVTVGSHSETVMLRYGNAPTDGNNDACGSASNTITLDFSDQAGAGHGNLSVVVSQPQYDNCRTVQNFIYPFTEYGYYGGYSGTYTGGYGRKPSSPWTKLAYSFTYAYPYSGTQVVTSSYNPMEYAGCAMSSAYKNHILTATMKIHTSTTQ